ncbi:hypothetical protein TD95_000032 [Thielaviopsis punctulata]|uniref:FCP1 homology domain-containing protein n=1 Tax=Thielaviopsis punctulata TaxID=72032 RepID=A0A0F4Z819_9PEZI|nr:hypothetical protein TD95_000032 [Thielaviopsis punctulata]
MTPPNTQRKKKGSIFALLGCCTVPDNKTSMEEVDNVHRIKKLPTRPTTSRSTRSTRSQTHTPMDQAAAAIANLSVVNEKDSPTVAPSEETETKDKRVSDLSAQDQSTVGGAERESKQSMVAPSVSVQPPIEETAPVPPASPEPAKVEPEVPDAPEAEPESNEDEEEETTAALPAVPPPPPGPPAPFKNLESDPQEDGTQSLLPPIAPEHKGRKCLVLDLDETLVHSSFKLLPQADFTIPVEIEGSYHNVYVIKRPGVDEFMKRVGELYEVVVFTASVSKYGDPLLDQLDIHDVVHHRLFRESCYNHQGNYVKDLSQIGRPLQDTIIIDNSPTSYIFHPQHAVPISSWFSDAHDNELLDLIPVLEDLAGSNVRDVSLVLDVTL